MTILAVKGDKHNKVIAVLIAAIIIVSILIGVLVVTATRNKNGDDTATTEITEMETTGDNLILEDITEESENEGDVAEMEADENMLVIDEVLTQADTTKTPSTTKKQTGSKEEVLKPATTNKTPTTEYSLPASDNDSVKEYSCGKSGHHCESKETHSFIVSLEKKGCSICGSHSCKSFYAIDEWGNACYDISKCTKYSERKDPNKYCDECAKKIGNGSKGTCVRFTVDTKCPDCGKAVKARTCHTH
jgi:hypothetical protein